MEVRKQLAKMPSKAIAGKLVLDEAESAVTLKPKEFSTGSVGYMMSEKIEISGKRYQLTGNVVEIGSKPKPKN